MNDPLANLGYISVGKQTDPTIPVIPSVSIPFYDTTLKTNGNFNDLSPIAGTKFNNFKTVQGQRSHTGDVTFWAEPNTTAILFDHVLTKQSTSGSTGNYTHVYGLTGDSSSYTWDVSAGYMVRRYIGVQGSKIEPDWNSNEMRWKMSVSALASFESREIASISGSGPYSVTLKTEYDPNPTYGLIADDLIQFRLANGTTVDAVVTAVTNSTTFTTTTNPTVSAGDSVYLRPEDPVYDLLPNFLWAKNYWKFGADATAAASASQLRVEQGSKFSITHDFNADGGEPRSGGFDPAALLRKLGGIDVTVKQIFDSNKAVIAFNNMKKNALQVDHKAGSTNQYGVSVIVNNMVTDSPQPDMKSDEMQYSTLKYHPQLDQTDGQGMSVSVTNALSTI